MAYVKNNNNNNYDEADDNKPAPTLSATGGGTISGGQQAVQQQPATVTAPKTQATFTNIQKYLDVNRGAGQANAESLIKTTDTPFNQAKNIETTAQTGLEAVSKGTNKVDQALLEKSKTSPQLLTDDEKAKVKEMLSGTFTGPTTFDTSAEDLAAKQLKEKQDALQTEAGRIQALQEGQTAGKQSRGGAVLDNLFIQTQGGADTLNRTVGQRVTDINDLIAQKKEALDTAVRAGKETSDTTRGTVQRELGAARTKAATDAQIARDRYVAQEQARVNAEYDALRQTGGFRFTPEQAAKYGVSTEEINNLIGRLSGDDAQARLDFFNSVIKKPDVASNVKNEAFLSPEARAKIDALGGILGSTDVLYNQGEAFNPNQQYAPTLDTTAYRNFLIELANKSKGGAGGTNPAGAYAAGADLAKDPTALIGKLFK